MGTALAQIDTQKTESQLQELTSQVNAMVVRDQETFVEARQLQKSCDSYIKSVGFELDPGISKAKELLDHLKDQKERFVGPAKSLKETIRQKADSFAEEEKRQAKVEEDRKNKELADEHAAKVEADRKETERIAVEARKAKVAEIRAAFKKGDITERVAEKLLRAAGAREEADKAAASAKADEEAAAPPKGEVKANIPKVAGVKNQTYYYGDVTNAQQIVAAFEYAIIQAELHPTQPNKDRVAFLRQFIQPNEQKVGEFARTEKDNAKATEQLPGVNFWSKG